MMHLVLGGMSSQVRFAILEETQDFLAVDKPAGLLIHPTRPDGTRTLWHSLRDLLAYEIVNGSIPGILTRLDRETSGIVLVGKNSEAVRELGALLAAGNIKKTYLALVFGWPEQTEWMVDAPILRLGEVGPSRVWLKRGVHPAGKPAITKFRTLLRVDDDRFGKFALVEAQPIHGRTHQIRVHLAHAGFPVVGDKLYARGEEWYLRFIEKGWTSEMERALFLPRHALHAAKLEFCWKNRNYAIRAPLPEDIASLLPREPKELIQRSCRPGTEEAAEIAMRSADSMPDKEAG